MSLSAYSYIPLLRSSHYEKPAACVKNRLCLSTIQVAEWVFTWPDGQAKMRDRRRSDEIYQSRLIQLKQWYS